MCFWLLEESSVRFNQLWNENGPVENILMGQIFEKKQFIVELDEKAGHFNISLV